ncbi:unnamed protein product [Caenorhabditis auriculariae]|uniref:Uncharacterized protein n=1 Tax=Caenorhabditis auriculariae TaxID=2777116 RepID=A0A8S1HE05_9PELO|nr:unnamed protein product [Caenorhabditis auriculariae]
MMDFHTITEAEVVCRKWKDFIQRRRRFFARYKVREAGLTFTISGDEGHVVFGEDSDFCKIFPLGNDFYQKVECIEPRELYLNSSMQGDLHVEFNSLPREWYTDAESLIMNYCGKGTGSELDDFLPRFTKLKKIDLMGHFWVETLAFILDNMKTITFLSLTVEDPDILQQPLNVRDPEIRALMRNQPQTGRRVADSVRREYEQHLASYIRRLPAQQRARIRREGEPPANEAVPEVANEPLGGVAEQVENRPANEEVANPPANEAAAAEPVANPPANEAVQEVANEPGAAEQLANLPAIEEAVAVADPPAIQEEVANQPANEDAMEVANEAIQEVAEEPLVAELVANLPANEAVQEVAEPVANLPANADAMEVANEVANEPVVAEQVANPPANEDVMEVANPPANEDVMEVANPPANEDVMEVANPPANEDVMEVANPPANEPVVAEQPGEQQPENRPRGPNMVATDEDLKTVIRKAVKLQRFELYNAENTYSTNMFIRFLQETDFAPKCQIHCKNWVSEKYKLHDWIRENCLVREQPDFLADGLDSMYHFDFRETLFSLTFGRVRRAQQ